MVYNITIGNAVPYFHKDEDSRELYAKWTVEGVTNRYAPIFPNSGVFSLTNYINSSTSWWHDFCQCAGIYDMFYDGCANFRIGNPGCVMLKKSDLERIREARINRERIAKFPPGFNKKQKEKYDPILARLLWLEWWMDWALQNCETPAIENS